MEALAIELREAPRAKVLRYVRENIADGVFVEGQPIPAERELARQVGVSAGTVNTALNELQERGILHSNGGRIRYVSRQNRGSRLLQNTFILVGHARLHANHRASGWSDWLDQGVVDCARKSGTHCLIFAADRLEEEWEHLLEANPIGICVNELINREWPVVQKLAKSHGCPPLVVYGDEAGMENYDRVSANHEAGGRLITQFLLEQGRRKIAIIGPDPTAVDAPYWFVERWNGYRRAMTEAGLEPLPVIAPPKLPYHITDDFRIWEQRTRLLAGYLADVLLDDRVDALVAPTDRTVPALAKACKILHKSPNEDVALVGYDHYWSDCHEREWENTPPLASIDKRYYECGQQLFELLQKRITGELPASVQKILVEPRLVVSP